MPEKLKLIGLTFGKLTVIEYVGILKGRTHWRCVCNCKSDNPNTIITSGKSLTGNHTKSCGCLKHDVLMERNYKHGFKPRDRDTAPYKQTYNIWLGMRTRCSNPKSPEWHVYGGRGITCCQEWDSFLTFLEDMGEAPNKLTLDRLDNNLGYSKSNCAWKTMREQCNNKSNNRKYTAFGETKTLSEWARDTRCNINYHTLKSRVFYKGEDLVSAMNKPILVAKTYEYNGESHTIREWANILGCKLEKLESRFANKWSTERALTQPFDSRY